MSTSQSMFNTTSEASSEASWRHINHAPALRQTSYVQVLVLVLLASASRLLPVLTQYSHSILLLTVLTT